MRSKSTRLANRWISEDLRFPQRGLALVRFLWLFFFLFACNNQSQHASLVRARAFGTANDHIRNIQHAVEQKDLCGLPTANQLIVQLENYLTILDEVAAEHKYPMASYFEAIYFAVSNTAQALYVQGEQQKADALLARLEPYLKETHLYGKLLTFQAEVAIEQDRLDDAAAFYLDAATFLNKIPSYDGASTRLWICDAWLKRAIQLHRLGKYDEAFLALNQYVDHCLAFKLHISGLGHAYSAFLGMLNSEGFVADDAFVNATFAEIEAAVDARRQAKLLDHPDLTEPDTPAREAFESTMSQRFQAKISQLGAFQI